MAVSLPFYVNNEDNFSLHYENFMKKNLIIVPVNHWPLGVWHFQVHC